MNKAVFIDRDGVLNYSKVLASKPFAPTSLKEFKLLPKVVESLYISKQMGFLNIVVTNQPDVRTGKQSISIVEEMHAKLMKTNLIDDIFTCFHIDEDNCDCRKPSPGMIIEAVKKYKINLSDSFLVGDRYKDIEAAKKSNCKSFLIDYQYDEIKTCEPDWIVKSLFEAVLTIKKMRGKTLIKG